MKTEIQQFNSEDFNYNPETLEKFLPLFSAYTQIMSNQDYGKNLKTSDLIKNLPAETDNSYAEQVFVHQMLDHISDNSKVYVLNKDENNKVKPTSIAIFSKLDNDPTYVLEVVQTIKSELGLGYAKQLLKYSFDQLKDEALNVVAHVEDDNYASIALNESLGTYCLKQKGTEGVIDFNHIISENLLRRIKDREQEQEKE